MAEMIEHTGIVREIGPEGMKVRILSEPACSACHAREICGSGNSREKEITIREWQGNFHPGEQVQVMITESLGLKALFYSYILPFLLVLLCLVVLTAGGTREWLAGILSLSVLVPYYLILYVLRKRIDRVFSFSVSRFT
ncbi:MAG TPA: Fis family transcriptional regulator [Bacteroidetes bacterium]|nr:Fis family transcriptional regulator [Bacteroidota bacterium]